MANNTAKIIAALGASALGFQSARKMNEDIEDKRADRAAKKQDREYLLKQRANEEAYKTDQQQLAQQMTQDLANAGNDSDAKRVALMKAYEQRGLLDAKYGKGGIADMEANRKAVQGLQDEGMLQGHLTYMQTGDAKAAGEVFNKFGKKRINLDSLQAAEETEPISGQKVSVVRGQYEDGSAFAYNPYVEARKIGGMAGMMQDLKEKQTRQEKKEDTQAGYDQQTRIVKIQGENSLNAARVAASNGASAVQLQREQFEISKKDKTELEGMFSELQQAEEKGDQSKVNQITRRIQLKQGKLGNGGAETKRYQTSVVDGQAITTDTMTGDQWLADPSSMNRGKGGPQSGAASASSASRKPAEATAAKWSGPLPVGMKQYIGNSSDGKPVFVGADGKRYVGN